MMRANLPSLTEKGTTLAKFIPVSIIFFPVIYVAAVFVTFSVINKYDANVSTTQAAAN